MREEILNRLNNAKSTFESIMENYSDVLPQNITEGSINSIEVEIPKFVNNFLYMLNVAEQNELYPKVSTVNEAIELFQNPNLDNSIAKALENKSVVGVSETGNMTSEQILEAARFGIESGEQLLSLQLSAGKMSKGEF